MRGVYYDFKVFYIFVSPTSNPFYDDKI